MTEGGKVDERQLPVTSRQNSTVAGIETGNRELPAMHACWWKRNPQDFLQRRHRHERDVLADFRGKFDEIGAIHFREHERLDSMTAGRERFFADAADGQDQA